MKIKVKQIVGEQSITTRDGRHLKKIQFLTEDENTGLLDTFGSVEVGQEYEGDIKEDQYGKHFSKVKTGGTFGRIGGGDPDTMLISYAKDVVVAFIEKGKIATPETAAKQISNLATAIFRLYDNKKAGKPTISKIESDEKPTEEVHEKPENENDEEIDLDDVPFE